MTRQTSVRVAVVAALLALAPLPARADWSAPVVLATERVPDVAVSQGPAAIGVFTWAGVYGVETIISPTGETAQTVRIAVDAAGNAVFVWLSFASESILRVRARSAAGDWSATRIVATGRIAGPELALDPAGNAIITWAEEVDRQPRYRTFVRSRSPAGVLGPPQALSRPMDNVLGARLAIDGDGNALFVWIRRSPDGDRLQARVRSAAGVLTPTENISARSRAISDVDVALDAGGTAVVAWASNGVRGTRMPDGTLGEPQALRLRWGHSTRISVDPAGNAVVVWRGSEDNVLESRMRSAAGQLGPVRALGLHTNHPKLATGADGEALLVSWTNSREVIAHAGP